MAESKGTPILVAVFWIALVVLGFYLVSSGGSLSELLPAVFNPTPVFQSAPSNNKETNREKRASTRNNQKDYVEYSETTREDQKEYYETSQDTQYDTPDNERRDDPRKQNRFYRDPNREDPRKQNRFYDSRYDK